MINSFKSYLVEESKSVYFTFGRMNPPTIGHEKLMRSLSEKSGKNPYRVYLSQSQDKKKNPLSFTEKIKYARKMFPKHARQIMADKKIKNVFDVATKLYNEGYKHVSLVVGSDRINEFKVLLNKYNGKQARHGFYNFEKINVISAGERDPDADGATGMSASKMRQAVTEKNFTKFSQGLPRNMSNTEAKKLYNSVRIGMGLKEQKVFQNLIQLEKLSDIREAYVKGMIFNIGDQVIVKENDEVTKVIRKGPNYVIVENSNGHHLRKWLHDIEPLYVQEWNPLDNEIYEGDVYEAEERKKKVGQDPDVKDRPGTQPKPYYGKDAKGKELSKATKAARARHFEKGAKMDDDNPAAYKPAPGDARAKTKPSKHTIKFKKMYGEDIKMTKARIEREKENDKRKHDRMMDRARLRAAVMKNRETKV